MYVSRFLCLLSLICTFVVAHLVNKHQPGPYMDEIFHYPQAQKFYNGVYTEYDDKITTPPGLYLHSAATLVPIARLSRLNFSKLLCFRIINVFFTIGNYFLVYKILLTFHTKRNPIKKNAELSALNISMLPSLYFFSFLYYTDCGSTFFVLLMFLLHRQKSFWIAAVFGGTSLLFRQTNIVWVFYVAAERSLHILLLAYKEAKIKKHDQASRKTKLSESAKTFIVFLRAKWKTLIWSIGVDNLGYMNLASAFLTFLFYNGSVALGDKAAHQTTLNIPQLLYFLLFTLFFASPYLVTPTKLKGFGRFILTHKSIALIFFITCSFCITYLSQVHPYLLADNRHLTFYIWKRLLNRNIYLSHVLIPLYFYACWAILSELKYQHVTLLVVFAFCVSISVIPQKLLEFRYFIIPFIMTRLHFRALSRWQVYAEFGLFTLVNGAVLYLFLFKTFSWENSQAIQRFMW